MNIQDAQNLKDTLTSLVSQFDALPVNFSNGRDGELKSEILMTLDPYRESLRPFLIDEYDQAVVAASAAVLPYCNNDDKVAHDFAHQLAAIRFLRAQKDNFGDASRALVPDARKAIAILTQLIDGS